MLNTYKYVLPRVVFTVISSTITAYGFGRFNFRGQKTVCIGNRTLCLEVKHITYSPDYHADIKLTAGVYSKVVVLDDGNAFKAGDSLAYYIHALVHVKEAALVLIDTHGNYYLVKHNKGPFQYIQVTCGKGVEGTGE